MQAYLITGNTYPHRRAMRAAGALFDRHEGGYVCTADNQAAIAAAESAGLDIEPYDATEEQVTPATGERLRQVRQERIDRRKARLLDRAERAEARADKAAARISPGERDFLALGEPIKIGHHSERRHRKLIERIQNATDAEFTERRNADELRSRADWMLDARVKGDRERDRQAKRDAADAVIGKGDTIADSMYGESVVLAVNTKTYRIKTPSGFVTCVDKSWSKLVKKGEPCDEPASGSPKYKKGDRVTVRLMARTHPGVILRRTPKGYSVEWETDDRTHPRPDGSPWTRKDTFLEANIMPRE